MIPRIDSHVGIGAYATGSQGIGGSIRDTPESFRVDEVISDGALASIREGPGYAVYVLEKRNIDTAHALSGILDKTGIRLKALGLKDASAVTRQFVCSVGRGRSLERFAAERFSIERIGFARRPLSKRDMVGNGFRIRISGHGPGLEDFAEHGRILNFYGYQRFGSRRPVTHLVGEAILRRDFGRAVELILSYAPWHGSGEDAGVRRDLSDAANYRRCLGTVPPRMDTERAVLRGMVEHGDPLRALRSIPVQMRRFYVQAYQSYLFNRTLSEAFAQGEDLFGPREDDVCFGADGAIGKSAGEPGSRLAVPFVGHSYYRKTRFHRHVSAVLESEGVSPGDFFIKEMQEVSGEGGFRQSAIRCTGYAAGGDTVEFTLSRGSFATILLREIMKPADPILAGF